MLAKAFYLRLAAGNLLRNKRMYGPFVVAAALMSSMFFIILTLIFSRSIANLSYGGTVQSMFTFGIVVMTLFTVGYMLYINSFLIRRRKKEFGLYGVLGMEKRHVARVILWESLVIGFVSLGLGLLSGSVFGRLVFMLLMNVLDTARGSAYVFSPEAMLTTLAVFTVIFLLTTLYNLNQVRLANPIDLLKGEKKGEKKSRLTIPAALLGTALLGLAYCWANTAENPGVALVLFWPSVILVIIATWLLFTGGSAFILARLKKSKRIYYKPHNFIAISGLIHRMKQNAAGLANICILSTMVMVTVACCCSLYLGQEDAARQMNPHDVRLDVRLSDEGVQEAILTDTLALAESMAAERGIDITNALRYRFYQGTTTYANRQLSQMIISVGMDQTSAAYDTYRTVYILTLADYNAATGTRETLLDGEALLLTDDPALRAAEMPTADAPLSIKKVLTGTPFPGNGGSQGTDTLFLVVRDQATADALARQINPANERPRMTSRLVLDTDADLDTGHAFAQDLRGSFIAATQDAIRAQADEGMYRTDDIYGNRLENYAFYGGLLFLGVFFAVLFLVNTVLLIYFKQISEGFDDAERFEIMQKVGLSDAEVKSTINRQMLIVFLAPLVFALVHIGAASNLIQMMLASFRLDNFLLTLRCIVATSAVFMLVYLIVYRLTTRVYYRLVRW